MKRHHDHDNSNHLIGLSLQFRGLVYYHYDGVIQVDMVLKR